MELTLNLNVTIADRYLEDAVGLMAKATKNARVLSIPSDEEELVMVQYDNMFIDYVPQDIIEHKIYNHVQQDTHTFVIDGTLTKSEVKKLGLDEDQIWLMNEIGFKLPKNEDSWEDDCFNVISEDDCGNGEVELFMIDKLPERFKPTVDIINVNRLNYYTWEYDSSEGITDKKVIIRKVNECDSEDNYYNEIDDIFPQLIREGVTDFKIRI